ncbi:MAG: ribonuclease J [Acidimicrobiia bacterium]|nr:ribonuclease J [Acidimicrobiia bacterium]
MSVKITFLGGLGEIGRNCAAIEHDGKIALIDCGLMFPEADMLGVDLVFPNWEWLIERKQDVECVIVTHGHEDHVGALAYFLKEFPGVPVYGTQLSVALARGRVDEIGVEAEFIGCEDNRWIEHKPFGFMFVPVSHSIPQGAGIVFDTPEGFIVHSGDFKLDPTPVDGRPTDLQQFAHFGREGVRLLMADSTNAEIPGFVPSETSLASEIGEIIAKAGGRVVAACFASHVHRVQQIADAGIAAGRTVAFAGRSMHRVSGVGTELGVLDIPADKIVEIQELTKLPAKKQLLITTGSQGEPFAALSLMAAGRHKWVTLEPDDTVLISATPIPGNEAAVSKVISKLNRTGARVYHGRNAKVHVSGHAARDELTTFLNVIRPKSFVPVHGEYRHLRAHAELADQMKVPDVNILEDGDMIEIKGDRTHVTNRAVDASYVYFDGTGDVNNSVLRARGHLSDDGVVVVTVGVQRSDSSVILGPDIDSHGFADDPRRILAKAAEAVRSAVTELDPQSELGQYQKAVRLAAQQVIRAETSRKPVVIPVVLEV